MTGRFTFPPPPPPPPRTTISTAESTTHGQNLRGDRSFAPRARGGWRGASNKQPRGGGGGGGGRGGSQSRLYRGGRGAYGESHSVYNGRPRIGTPVDHTGHVGAMATSKRQWSDAFTSPRRQIPKGNAPPAVPSFGFDLLPAPRIVTPLSQPTLPLKKRKERKHNQLGLTPNSDGQASSEGEDDEDEEARLASALRGDERNSGLQFEHNGRVMHLSNPKEIAAWIAERRRRYPTKSRIAEVEAERAKAKEAAKAFREQMRSSRNGVHAKPTEKPGRKSQKSPPTRAEASAQNAKSDVASTDLESMQQKADRSNGLNRSEPSFVAKTILAADDTSSSGLTDSSDDSDSAPEERSSKTETTEATNTVESKHGQVCRYFRQDGRCRFGKRCGFHHDVSEFNQERETRLPKELSKGFTLYDRLMERQQQEENEELLRYVLVFGERGYLDHRGSA